MTVEKPRKKDNIIEKKKKEGGGLVFDVMKGELFELNDTGLAILSLCDGKRTIKDIQAALAKDYELSDKDLKSAADYVKELSGFGLLE
ncbi:MAG: PqqD family protein [Candidatus Altiarchaeota archaeon]